MANVNDIKFGTLQVNRVYSGDVLLWEKYINTSPPTTTARPATGTYTAVQTVYLDVDEASITYYTTDGSTPTVNSTVYTAGIPINQTTTLNYFSVDWVGNVESVKTSVYTINLPTVGNMRYIKFQGYGDQLSSYTRLIELKAIETGTSTNLLYQKTPISGEAPTLGSTVDKATDNSIAMTSGTFPVWSGEGVPTLVYDLGSIKNVTQLQMYMYSNVSSNDGRQTQFKLWHSEDQTNWCLVADYSVNTTVQSQTLGWRFDTKVTPSQPGSVVATPGVDQVTLTWTNTANAANYTVYRSTVSGQLGTAISTNQSATSYLDLIEGGSTYYYTIRANNCNGYTDSTQVTGIPGADGLLTRYIKIEGYGSSNILETSYTRMVEVEVWNRHLNLLLPLTPISYDPINLGDDDVKTMSDGDKASYYPVWTGAAPNANIIFDLGEEPYPLITKMEYFGKSTTLDQRKNYFKILTSLTNNGTDWTTVWDMSDTDVTQPLLPNGYEQYFTQKWRYLRFQGFGDSLDPSTTELVELRANDDLGINRLLGLMPISGEEPSTGNIEWATDGNADINGNYPTWTTSSGVPDLIYDMALSEAEDEWHITSIDVVMYSGTLLNARATRFKLWLSTDGERWTNVVDYSDNNTTQPTTGFTINLNYWSNQ